MATQRVYQAVGRRDLYAIRSGMVSPRQGGAYTSNNPYVWTRNISQGMMPQSTTTVIGAQDSWLAYQPPPQEAYNRLYGKFIDAYQGDRAQLGAAVGEWRSSLNMVSQRCIQLRNAYRALKQFDLPRVAGELMMSPSQAHQAELFARKKLARPTEAWLEYWLGWAPMIGDVYNALDVIQRPSPGRHISVGVPYELPRLHSKDWNDYWGGTFNRVSVRKGRLAAFGECEITNRNLHIANQLGLLNPISVAWELVPFSFVVDWFLNVGQVVGSLTDSAGLKITNTGTAVKQTSVMTQQGALRGWVGPVPNVLQYYSGEASGVHRQRDPGSIPFPQFELVLPKLSLTRAATAISLLVEVFLVPGKLLKK